MTWFLLQGNTKQTSTESTAVIQEQLFLTSALSSENRVFPVLVIIFGLSPLCSGTQLESYAGLNYHIELQSGCPEFHTSKHKSLLVLGWVFQVGFTKLSSLHIVVIKRIKSIINALELPYKASCSTPFVGKFHSQKCYQRVKRRISHSFKSCCLKSADQNRRNWTVWVVILGDLKQRQRPARWPWGSCRSERIFLPTTELHPIRCPTKIR